MLKTIVESLNLIKIGCAAKMIGCPVSVLRYWDKSGVLKPKFKSPGGTRYYSKAQIEAFQKEVNDEKS